MVTKVKKELIEGLQAAIEAAVGEALGFDIDQYYQKAEVDDALDLKADAAATTAALAEKADADDIAAAIAALEADIPAQIASGIAPAIELQKTFVASGAITDKLFGALRSDGKVEAVSGTETLYSIGAENTELSVTTSFNIRDAVYHASTGKIAIVFVDSSGSVTKLAIGTVSGDTIDFGTAVDVNASLAAPTAKIVWKADGSGLFVAYQGGSNVCQIRGASVSGNAATISTADVNVVNASTSVIGAFIDEGLSGGRVIAICAAHIGTASYSGVEPTTDVLTASFPNTGTTNRRAFYDAANHRAVHIGYSGTQTTVTAGIVSAGSFSAGSEVQQTTAVMLDAAMASDGKVLFIASSGTGVTPLSGYVVTFSSSTATINTGVNYGYTTNDFLSIANRCVITWNDTLSKFVVAASLSSGNNAITTSNMFVFLATISGTSSSITEPQLGFARETPATRFIPVFVNTAGTEVCFIISDDTDGGRIHYVVLRNVSDVWTLVDDGRVRSEPAMLGAMNGTSRFVQGGWAAWDLGNWSATTGLSGFVSTTLSAYHFTLPTESTNADAWIGQAQATVADAGSVNFRLKGSIATGLSGLTPGVDQYLKGDGTLTTTPNGRRIGKALSATELLMEAA